jgi:hypothetical protein
MSLHVGNDNLDSLAEMISAAELAADQAAAAVNAATAKRDKLSGRHHAMQAERAAIVARRQGGDTRDNDGPALALLACDMEGVAGLLVTAEGELEALLPPQVACTRALNEARANFDAEKSRVACSALDAHAEHLFQLLGETLQAYADASVSLALHDRGDIFVAAVNRLCALDALVVGQISAARAVSKSNALPYGLRPTWMPSDNMRNEITKAYLYKGQIV